MTLTPPGLLGFLCNCFSRACTRGFFHARVKRVVLVALLYWATRSGWAAFNALLSRRLLVTVCQVAFQPSP